jgi:hypothetical protein
MGHPEMNRGAAKAAPFVFSKCRREDYAGNDPRQLATTTPANRFVGEPGFASGTWVTKDLC